MGEMPVFRRILIAAVGAAAFAGTAGAEDRTDTIEFTAPRDSYERLHLGREGDIKLRGWYLRGGGIADPDGAVRRALVIMTNGGGEITAIDHPGFAVGTRLRLEQSGFRPDQKQAYGGAKAGWPQFFAKLEQVLARTE